VIIIGSSFREKKKQYLKESGQQKPIFKTVTKSMREGPPFSHAKRDNIYQKVKKIMTDIVSSDKID